MTTYLAIGNAKTLISRKVECQLLWHLTLGQITVIAFDEDPVTLGAVREGSFAGTVVQDPYQWGYQGMHLMADYLEGDSSKVPNDGLIIVPTKVIDKSNVDEFEAVVKERIGG